MTNTFMGPLVTVALRERGALERTMPCVSGLRYPVLDGLRFLKPLARALDLGRIWRKTGPLDQGAMQPCAESQKAFKSL
jgi:hypothetical protein